MYVVLRICSGSIIGCIAKRGAGDSLEGDVVEKILREARVIAVVGASRNPEKPSHKVPACLKNVGYEVVPVNPSAKEIFGVKAYERLKDIPEDILRGLNVVEIFRPSREFLEVVREAIDLKKKYGRPWTIWMQLGITNEGAKREAEREGLLVVMDRCMMVKHKKLMKSYSLPSQV